MAFSAPCGGVVCWNCERPTNTFTEVRLHMPSGHSARDRLCGTCHATVYRPLVQALEGVREERDWSGGLRLEDGPARQDTARWQGGSHRANSGRYYRGQ